ncbi:MAG: PrgI family protein [bacterium]|uniref:PrgI family mobile element protein n=1 Tax=Clostridium baratii TaxID=1561 RepID=UPI0005F2BF85|nr:PrgI family protein [Clostridium baratii]AQM58635.1 PrgI family protein [Clostridium baratii]KJU70944.1 hypothetical protein UC77_12290 [Clostridium baratii]MDO5003732.1 PrgI family protein [bacterium]
MTNYKIPFDLSYEDKIIGGKLSIRQALWFAIPVGLILFSMQRTTIFMTKLPNGENVLNFGFIAAFIFVEAILMIIASIFSFTKVNGIYLDSYLMGLIKFKCRRKIIKNDE